MRKLLPVILALLGTAAGVGAGIMLSQPSDTHEEAGHDAAGEAHADPVECVPVGKGAVPSGHASDLPPEGREYVKLNNQFVVPVAGPDRVEALVVAALSIEVASGNAELVYSREPKLRDVLLQVFFDHANIGGFDGAFTTGARMATLRRNLLDAARPVLGDAVSDILITEIARQDS